MASVQCGPDSRSAAGQAERRLRAHIRRLERDNAQLRILNETLAANLAELALLIGDIDPDLLYQRVWGGA